MAADTDIIILDGCTFFYSDRNGDVDAEAAEGFFYQDVRHLSHWHVRVDGTPVEPLTSRRVDYFSARIVATPPTDGPDPAPVSVRRDRFVTEGTHEDVVLENLTDDPQHVKLELEYGCDFADVMEAQEKANGAGRSWQELTARSVTLWHERDGYRRGTVLSFNRRGRVLKRRASFDVSLRPRETWKLCVDMVPIVDGKRKPPMLRCDSFHEHAHKTPMSLDDWLDGAPNLITDNPAFDRTYRQSLLDVAALRVRPDDVKIKWAMPGGGLPWFMTVFGRDSIITAYEAIHVHFELALATLQALANMQSTVWDPWRDAEPGKILHELRRGILAATGKIPHTPYYGSHDSTPLWLILRDEYERWSANTTFVRSMEKHARAALRWLEGPADLDGDGYIEYRKRSDSDKALDNQCWKDSADSIRFADGRLAGPPIAVCEHQGYAYDARLRTARLLREVWDDEDEAQRLENDAARLKRRFNKDFWSTRRRHYVLALDGEKQQVDSMTSNVGHLLWSGIVDERRPARWPGGCSATTCSAAGASGRCRARTRASTRSSTTAAPSGPTTPRSSRPEFDGTATTRRRPSSARPCSRRPRRSRTSCPRSSPATRATTAASRSSTPTRSSPSPGRPRRRSSPSGRCSGSTWSTGGCGRPRSRRSSSRASRCAASGSTRRDERYSTVTVFARFRGWSTFSPRSRAVRYASSCSGSTASTACRNAGVRGT
jgi:glycogen debranching enzyme